jgi:hypothetical protein
MIKGRDGHGGGHQGDGERKMRGEGVTGLVPGPSVAVFGATVFAAAGVLPRRPWACRVDRRISGSSGGTELSSASRLEPPNTGLPIGMASDPGLPKTIPPAAGLPNAKPLPLGEEPPKTKLSDFPKAKASAPGTGTPKANGARAGEAGGLGPTEPEGVAAPEAPNANAPPGGTPKTRGGTASPPGLPGASGASNTRAGPAEGGVPNANGAGLARAGGTNGTELAAGMPNEKGTADAKAFGATTGASTAGTASAAGVAEAAEASADAAGRPRAGAVGRHRVNGAPSLTSAM